MIADLRLRSTRPGAAAAPAACHIPTILRSDIRMGKFLGQGSFGEVYEATHVPNGAKVAVKILRLLGSNASRPAQESQRAAEELMREVIPPSLAASKTSQLDLHSCCTI